MIRTKAVDQPLLLLESIRHRRLPKENKVRLPEVPVPLLCYSLKGKGSLLLGHIRYALEPHQLYFVAPGTALEASAETEQIDYIVLTMKGMLLSSEPERCRDLSKDEYSSALLPVEPGKVNLQETALVLDRLLKLLQLAEQSGTGASRQAFSLNIRFQELLLVISEQLDHDVDPFNVEDGIEKTIEYMHARYMDKIKLETLSRLAGFTPTSYSREFKRLKGVSPFEYLNVHRIAQAKQLLAERIHSVKEVAASVGFSSEFYFSRMFKREAGVAPTLYMKRRQIRVGIASCMRVQDNLSSLGLEHAYAINCHRSKMVTAEEHSCLVEERLNGLASAKPELILCDHHHLPYLEQLKRIAPVVSFELTFDWRAVHARIAHFVGREKEAERNFKQMDDMLSRAMQPIVRRFGQETVTVMKLAHQLIRVQGTVRHPLNLLLYSELGLKPGSCVPTHDSMVEYALDKFPNLGTDHLFVQHSIDPHEDHMYESIRRSTQWRSIHAVATGCLYDVPNWVAMSWSPHGRMRIVEELLRFAE